MKAKWNNKLPIYSSFLLLAFLCLFLVLSFNTRKSLDVNNGKLYLSELDMQRNAPVNLNGDWEFYWNQLISPKDFQNNSPNVNFSGYKAVPDIWNNYDIPEAKSGTGCATYHLTIITDNGKGRIYGIKIYTEATSYKVFANNKVVLSAGTVGKTSETSVPQYNAEVAYFYSDSNSIDIVIQVSNFFYSKGGLWRSIEFGTDTQVRQSTTIALRTEMFIFGMLILAILFDLSIFGIYGRDTTVLSSTFVGLSFALRLLFSGEYYITKLLPFISFSTVIYVEYLTILLMPYALLVLARTLYKKAFSDNVFEMVTILVLIVFASELILPTIIYTKYVNFEIVFGAVIITYIIMSMTRGITSKKIREDALTFVISTIILLGCFLIEALDSKNLFSNRQMVYMVSLIGVVLLQVFITSARFYATFMNARESSRDAEELVNKKNDFFAYTYHELGIPLEGLVSITDMTLRDKDINGSKSIKNNILLMRQIENTLTDLIADIFEYAKFQGGSIKLEKRAFEFENAVNYAVHEINWKAHAKGVKIIVQNYARSMIITADEYKLIGIIHSILDVLVERSAISGVISLKIQKENGNALLSIFCNEANISKEKLDRYMKSSTDEKLKYSRADNKVCLKLTTAIEVARAHGGDLTIGGSNTDGAEIKIILPIEKEYKKNGIGLEKRDTYIEMIGFNNENITVIDYQYSDLAGIAGILNNQGYSVKGYSDAEEGLKEILGKRNTSIAIIDLVLPHVSGYEICRKIREQFTVSELPILLTSGRMSRNSIIEGLSFGANDVILKPFEPEELVARVNTLKNLKDSTEQVIGNEIAMLQAQINPHFLLNVMNSLAACILNKNETEQVYDIISMLSDYLRLCYKLKPENKLIPLENEVELIQNYLALEKLRFEERLVYTIQFEDMTEILIPPLIIQPLVENAVQHGIFNKAGLGEIEVYGRYVESGYQITVEDNGIGISQDILDKIMLENYNDTTIGIGLSNVRKRIMKKYGSELQIESILGKGTKISYTIKPD